MRKKIPLLQHSNGPHPELARIARMSKDAHCRCPATDGFTLLELLVVLVILSLMTGAVAIAARAGSGAERRAAASRIATELGALRQQAIARGVATAYQPMPGQTLEPAPGAPPLVGAAPDRLVFFPDGSASGGTLRLGPGKPLILIRVNWSNGGVAIDE